MEYLIRFVVFFMAKFTDGFIQFTGLSVMAKLTSKMHSI